MLHTIAAGTRDVQQQQVIFLAHARDHGYSYQPGELTGADRARRRVQLGEIARRTANSCSRRASRIRRADPRSLGSQPTISACRACASTAIDSQKQAETFNEALRVRVFRSIARDEPFRVAIVGAARPAWNSRRN